MKLPALNLWLAPITGISGLAVLAIGASALTGKLIRAQQLYLWAENDPGMALNTAIAFVLTGVALMASGLWMQRHTDLPITDKTEPIDILGVAMLFVCVVLMLAGIVLKQATLSITASYILVSMVSLLYKKRWRKRH